MVNPGRYVVWEARPMTKSPVDPPPIVSVWNLVLCIFPAPSIVKPADEEAVPSFFMTNLVVPEYP